MDKEEMKPVSKPKATVRKKKVVVKKTYNEKVIANHKARGARTSQEVTGQVITNW